MADIDQFRGEEIVHTGDGIVASFDGPTRAVSCAQQVSRAVAALGLTVHLLYDLDNLFFDRRVSLDSPQLAVRISENLDAGGTVLGNCQWGTPLGLDGCIVYTQRARNFIDSTCPADPAEVLQAE